MRTFEVEQAEANLTQLIYEAAEGNGFIITVAGKPVVQVVAIATDTPSDTKRSGFMAGQITIPSDFDRMASAEVEQLFIPRP